MLKTLHHLNFATLNPPFVGRIVCHCLCLETSDGLILVDTGLGTQNIKNPKSQLGKLFCCALRPILSLEETALYQIRNLGFQGEDVKDIFLTHLDTDHAGGIADFPQARIHVSQIEFDTAMNPPSTLEKGRYVPTHWQHNPKWKKHDAQKSHFFDWPASEILSTLGVEIQMVFLPGHTRGHCGIAIQTTNGWLLHAGDSYFYHKEMDLEKRSCQISLKMFQAWLNVSHAQRLKTQNQLYELKKRQIENIRIFCSHDVWEYNELK